MPIDYSKYPKDWKSGIVPRILYRANNCCENCRLENGQSVYSVGLKILDYNKYKVKRIWLTNESDITRIAVFQHWEDPKWIKVVLTIAHLDHDETNHDVKDDRLAAWCQYCHLNYDAVEKTKLIAAKSKYLFD